MLAGVPFVPVDVKATPMERVKVICHDCQARLLLTKRAVDEALEMPEVQRIYVEEEKPKGWGYGGGHTLPSLIIDEELAYIMYTSGSTGKPKGWENLNKRFLFVFNVFVLIEIIREYRGRKTDSSHDKTGQLSILVSNFFYM
jgi:long-subunit acyl-CoA synthetase (AMP-forming)